MTTVLHARPRRFVATPSVERVATRALRYLQSGFSVHLRGPAGTGKTTLALHLADLLSRPIMLLFGDDEFKTSDLIGNQSGYTRKKVVDNFIHSVVKVEDELRQNWVDSRLTLACREGFTLVYDEFNRSRPEVNNVLLSALEEKLLVLPPSNNRTEYVRVDPHFRAIFTSNPEEYVGVHATQDALMDRLVTINMPEPDELTQQEIVVQKTGIDRESGLLIVRLVKAFRQRTNAEKVSGLRSCLMLSKVCQEHNILALPENSEFREMCQDVLLSRTSLSSSEATHVLWQLFNELISEGQQAILSDTDDFAEDTDTRSSLEPSAPVDFDLNADHSPELNAITAIAIADEAPASLGYTDLADFAPIADVWDEVASTIPEVPVPLTARELAIAEPTIAALTAIAELTMVESPITEDAITEAPITEAPIAEEQVAEEQITEEQIAEAPDLMAALEELEEVIEAVSHEQRVYDYLKQAGNARPSEIEAALGISRFDTVNALRSLTDRGVLAPKNGSDRPSNYQVHRERESN